jgi:hypothetical protein
MNDVAVLATRSDAVALSARSATASGCVGQEIVAGAVQQRVDYYGNAVV